MKYIDEFRNDRTARMLLRTIQTAAKDRKMTLMEVCGTHTMSIARYGIQELLPQNIRLISGPGCPVCVTSNRIVDRAIALSRRSDVILTTFGDMIKVPGSTSNLDHERAKGARIQVVSSTLEALDIAERIPEKKIVFLGIGFETTAPTVALSLKEAKNRRFSNYFVLSAHKVMPPALEALSKGNGKIDGYLLPGHVSAIIGTRPYHSLVSRFGIGCVVAGFEPTDILHAILMLVKQIQDHQPRVEIQYTRAVSAEGNIIGQQVIQEVFEPCDSEWRGLGTIPQSGLNIRPSFLDWDAEQMIPVEVESTHEPEGCLCGRVLSGKTAPRECPYFGKACTPDTPIGACMVSSEGTCAAYYKYER